MTKSQRHRSLAQGGEVIVNVVLQVIIASFNVGLDSKYSSFSIIATPKWTGLRFNYHEFLTIKQYDKERLRPIILQNPITLFVLFEKICFHLLMTFFYVCAIGRLHFPKSLQHRIIAIPW